MQPDMTRRTFAVLTLAGLLAACGTSDDASTDTDPDTTPGTTPGDGSAPAEPDAQGFASVAVSDREPGGDPAIAGQSITTFGFDLFAALAALNAPDADVTISPASVAIALAMLEPGTVADAQSQLRTLLSIDDPAAFHASMNGLEQALEGRVPEDFGDGDPGEITMRISNASFLQPGYPFEADYLDTVGRYYGPVVNELDFAADPDAAVEVINAFVADATEGRITDPLAPGSIPVETVLALVNTLFLTASWFSPFDQTQTAAAPFTTIDGSTTDVDMMRGFGNASRAGDGWVGATKHHVGSISSQFVLPDPDRFDDVAGRLAETFDELTNEAGPGGEFGMPRFETRVDSSLDDPLKTLGLTAPFVEGNLLGIADDPRLLVSSVAHSTFVAYDEEGVEAAAATIILAGTTSAPVEQPVPVILDRPFFYRIVDEDSGATLFLGRVMNPSAG